MIYYVYEIDELEETKTQLGSFYSLEGANRWIKNEMNSNPNVHHIIEETDD